MDLLRKDLDRSFLDAIAIQQSSLFAIHIFRSNTRTRTHYNILILLAIISIVLSIMTLVSSSSSSADGSTGASAAAPPQSTAPTKTQSDDSSITPLQLGLAAVILGTSAGLTLYTKKTGKLMNQLERVSKNATQRKGPPKFGPKNKMEWEKTRSRWEKDDL
mmetsp:Transcript_21652/g.47065  ORF Transcript_21652/g.47065 Transcript_21652/m.47065 type:complete len:161 (+) Transcript_21652:476-958(+)